MSRKRLVKKREIVSDPIYNSGIIAKLINRAMRSGKKSVAQKQVYWALENLSKKQEERLEFLRQALENIRPQMEVRPRRIGGAAYQVPVPVRPDRSQALAIRWLIQAAQARASSQYHSFAEKLAAEIKDALQGKGGAVEKRKIVERTAEANKAFAHFRW